MPTNKKAIPNISVKSTERGWAGHYCCADRCMFRRNTLVEASNGIKLVVSSVGAMRKIGAKDSSLDSYESVGCGRFYETMVFHADNNGKYIDADVCRNVTPSKKRWFVKELNENSDNEANDVHQGIVSYVALKLLQGYTFPVDSEEPEE
jgi:hypothetical protein